MPSEQSPATHSVRQHKSLDRELPQLCLSELGPGARQHKSLDREWPHLTCLGHESVTMISSTSPPRNFFQLSFVNTCASGGGGEGKSFLMIIERRDRERRRKRWSDGVREGVAGSSVKGESQCQDPGVHNHFKLVLVRVLMLTPCVA
jgi:hypothetical protein